MMLAQNFTDVWSGILEDLPNLIDLAKIQNAPSKSCIQQQLIKYCTEALCCN
jgi:hypothetical protein